MKKILMILAIMSFNVFALDSSLKFRFPIANRDRDLIASFPIIGMDHDQQHGSDKKICQSNKGMNFPFCYNDHEGTDFMLLGGFVTMDHGSAEVVAAAAGEVIEVIDGNYDRCFANPRTQEVGCGGRELLPNLVTILHANGMKTTYAHFKSGSISVKKWQHVECGESLGLVGSSGKSAAPHLHFDVKDSDGNYVDPYKGKFSQPFSLWNNEFMADGLPSGSCQATLRPISFCTFQLIQDGAVCGTELITDALICGSDVVTCGKEVVSCGTKTVTSAAQCGVSIVNNIYECAKNGFGLIRGCQIAKTCNVAVTCEVDKKCNVARSCQRPKTCTVCM